MEELLSNYSALFNSTVGTSPNTLRNTSVVTGAKLNPFEWVSMLPPYMIIFSLSITGNCMVIATLTNNRRMRTVTNIYLLNLAISDLLLGVLCMPFTLIGQIYKRFLFGAAMCKLIPFLQAVTVSVGVWTLVAISLERYFAICRPLKSRKWQTQCHAYKMIATVWTLSLILDSPILLVSTLQPMRGNAFKCRENWQSLALERSFNLLLDVVLLLTPFLVMVIAYSLIVSKLWRGMRHEIQHNETWQNYLKQQSVCKNTTPPSTMGNSITEPNSRNAKTKPKDPESKTELDKKTPPCCMQNFDFEFRHVVRSTHIDKSIEAKRKVIRMLFVIILEFFVCWTPLHVINTIYLFYPEELYQYIGSNGVMSLQLLAFCSSFCNPITYCFMNLKFRQAFLGLFKNCTLSQCCAVKEDERAKLPTATPPPQSSSQEITACVIRGSHTARSGKLTTTKTMSWMDKNVRIVFSSGSQSIVVSSGSHPALPAPVAARPITQVIETGEEGSQFLYKISWPRAGQNKVLTQPLYE